MSNAQNVTEPLNMRLTLYIFAILLSLFLIGLGLIGSLGTAVSYKYEVDDPTVKTTMNRLDNIDQKNEIENLVNRKQQLNSNAIIYGVVLVFGITSSSILILKRKRILKNG
mgnify:CR=1 FL=1|jgi:hypothetical protein